MPFRGLEGGLARVRQRQGRVGGGGGDLGDLLLHLEGVQPVAEGGIAGDLVVAGDLVEEGAGLVDETVVVAGADTGGVHRQTAGDVGMVDADDDPAVAGRVGGSDLELPARLTSKARAPRSQNTSNLSVFGWPVGDPGDVEIAGGAIGEANREAGPVVVLDGLEGVADCDLGVADDMAEGQRPLRDHGGQRAPVTSATGPQRNSAVSVRWLPRSASAPDPGPPR